MARQPAASGAPITSRTTDTTIHTWDLARAIGVDDNLNMSLVAWIDDHPLRTSTPAWQKLPHFGASVTYVGSLDLPTVIIGVPDDRAESTGVVYTAQSRVGRDIDPPPPTESRQKWTPASGTGYGASTGGTVS